MIQEFRGVGLCNPQSFWLNLLEFFLPTQTLEKNPTHRYNLGTWNNVLLIYTGESGGKHSIKWNTDEFMVQSAKEYLLDKRLSSGKSQIPWHLEAIWHQSCWAMVFMPFAASLWVLISCPASAFLLKKLETLAKWQWHSNLLASFTVSALLSWLPGTMDFFAYRVHFWLSVNGLLSWMPCLCCSQKCDISANSNPVVSVLRTAGYSCWALR